MTPPTITFVTIFNLHFHATYKRSKLTYDTNIYMLLRGNSIGKKKTKQRGMQEYRFLFCIPIPSFE